MTDAAAVRAFIDKWEQNAQKESAAAKEHFVDLCHLLGVKTPNDPGSGPNTYCFEKSLTKVGGSAGFADVWKRDRFAWEYKGKGKGYNSLREAYTQLLQYKDDLDNPPVLVVCDIARYEVHISFTGYKTRVEKFTNADLANASTRDLLRQVFVNPEPLRPVERTETITETVAAQFAQVAQFLERRKFAPTQIASFFMKVLFALFAEDISLLPAELMSKSLKESIRHPDEFPDRARSLFRAMREGGFFGIDRVPKFNGWLFVDDEVLQLNTDELFALGTAALHDWSQVEPAIFGTLFERSLDPSKRSELGAHYTSRNDILLIVEPVLMQPLRRDWDEVKARVEALRAQWEAEEITVNKQRHLKSIAEGILLEYMESLSKVRVLDPACGSGNFLYVALHELKALELEVWTYAGGVGLPQPVLGVSPSQLFGIEKNPFAAELAQVVVWIGYLQWLRNNGFLEGKPKEPILQYLHNIECRDALLTKDSNGQPTVSAWPEADVIIGNPPFLGAKWMQRELGENYKAALWEVYKGRVSHTADFVMYWFEKARAEIEAGRVKRAGLLATNTVRQGGSAVTLKRIKETGDIFLAHTDVTWRLPGAALRVSLVGFDNGAEQARRLNNQPVAAIEADLTSRLQLDRAKPLSENAGIAFRGHERGGPFLISHQQAQVFLREPRNQEVIFKWFSGLDLTQRNQNEWVIDFGTRNMVEAQAFSGPFEYLRSRWEEELEKAAKNGERAAKPRAKWWLHRRPATDLRESIADLKFFIVTPLVSKYRLFVWLEISTRPDTRVVAFARDDDYFFGVLHSKPHELWSLRQGAQHGGERPTYIVQTCFDAYPFPWPPGKEDQSDPKVRVIADAVRELVRLRDEWLNPPEVELLSGVQPKDRTLTNLYNRRPDWLTETHRKLDAAVFDAYGWPKDLSDDEILARLLALNLERAAGQGEVPVAETEGDGGADDTE